MGFQDFRFSEVMTNGRRSIRIQALKSVCNRRKIPSLKEFLAARKTKLDSMQNRPLITMLRKLKDDVRTTPSLWAFYTSLMRWLVNVQTTTFMEIVVASEEVRFIPGFLRFIKAIDTGIVPRIVKGENDTHVIMFEVDRSSPNLDDCVLDGDHLFPIYAICQPSFDILDASWC